jgi:hypothetical protein
MMVSLKADDQSLTIPFVSGSARPCHVALNTQRKYVVSALLGMGPLLLHVVTHLQCAGTAQARVVVQDVGSVSVEPPALLQTNDEQQDVVPHDHLTALHSHSIPPDSRVAAMLKLITRRGTVKDMLLGCTQLLAAGAPLQSDGMYSLEVLTHFTRDAVHAWFTQLCGVGDKIAAVLCLFGLDKVNNIWQCPACAFGPSTSVLYISLVEAQLHMTVTLCPNHHCTS